jgi:hypothetical protein
MTTIYDALDAMQIAVSGALAGIVTNSLETVTLDGTATPVDVVSLTMTSSGIAGSPVTVSYTVSQGDTLQSITAALAKAINKNAALKAAKLTSTPVVQGPAMQIYYPAVLSIAWAFSLSPSATETVELANVEQAPVVGVGWPSVNALQNIARGGSIVSIYDRKVGRNTTRWSPYTYDLVVIDATLTTEISQQTIQPHGSVSITLGGTVSPWDAVSCVLTAPIPNAPSQMDAVVAVSAPGDTPASMATKLAGLINGDSTISTWVTASASGLVVTLTGKLASPIAVQSYTGNGGTQMRELSRREAQLQITCWTQTQAARLALVGPITELLASLQVNFGPTFQDGTQARLECENDFPIEDDTLEDVYRHDFLLRVEFPITTQDFLFAVLAPIPAFAVVNLEAP